jgi:hypothetical protein
MCNGGHVYVDRKFPLKYPHYRSANQNCGGTVFLGEKSQQRLLSVYIDQSVVSCHARQDK